MSETLKSVAIDVDHKQLAEQLLAQAKEQGVELVGVRFPPKSGQGFMRLGWPRAVIVRRRWD
ncbi:hypothetical protein ACVWWN_000092 [Mycobacterium sp. URHB0021]